MRFVPNDANEGFKWLTRIIIGAVALLVIYELAIQKPRGEYKQPIFSTYNNSCYSLEAAIKRSMHDPDSYEHIETKHTLQDDHYFVKTSFRGKNALGAMVLSNAEATVDKDGGHVISWELTK